MFKVFVIPYLYYKTAFREYNRDSAAYVHIHLGTEYMWWSNNDWLGGRWDLNFHLSEDDNIENVAIDIM